MQDHYVPQEMLMVIFQEENIASGWGSSAAVEHLSVKRAARVRHAVEALDLERLHVHWCAMDLPQPVQYNWFIKGGAMCYHVCVIMHVKEPQSLIAKSRASSPGDRLLLGQAHQPVSHGDPSRTRQDKILPPCRV